MGKDSILESVRHYLEEGADHIFIYDKSPADDIKQELKCLDNRFYSVYNDSRVLDKAVKKNTALKGLGTQIGYQHMLYDVIKEKTDWLAVVDSDEFITSRAMPNTTIRAMIKSKLFKCAVISVPYLLFSWGATKTTPRNDLRKTLNYRWSFDPRFSVKEAATAASLSRSFPGEQRSSYDAENTPAGGVRHHHSQHSFRDRHDFVENRLLFRTASVTEFDQHHAMLKSDEDVVCVPHTERQLQCAKDPMVSKRFCPSFTQYQSVDESMKYTAMHEKDVDKLLLGCFHYQVKSWADWADLKTARSQPLSLEDDKRYATTANRMNVQDDFMTKVRAPARLNHIAQVGADKTMARCVDYFAMGGGSPSSGSTVSFGPTSSPGASTTPEGVAKVLPTDPLQTAAGSKPHLHPQPLSSHGHKPAGGAAKVSEPCPSEML